MAEKLTITTKVDKSTAELIDKLLAMPSGKAAHDAFGMCRDEIITHSVRIEKPFGTQKTYLVDVKCVVSDEDDPLWNEAVLFEEVDGQCFEIDFTDVKNEFFGEWIFRMGDNELVINVEREE